MARVPLPIISVDGIGAAYIPRASRMHGNAGDLLIAASNDVLATSVRAGLKYCKVPVLNTVAKGDATIFVVRPPADLDPNDLWVSCGLRATRTWDDDFNVDVTDRAALSKRFHDCLRTTGMTDMVMPRRIGLNLAGSTVFETVTGRVAVNKDNEAHYEYDRFSNGREKGEYRDRFLRAIRSSELAGCAAGVALAIVQGESFDRGSVAKLHKDIVGDESSRFLSVFSFQEEIEAALAVEASKLVREGAAFRSVARELTDRSAAHGERSAQRLRLQQYSTPLTISAVAQDILRIRAGELVLEPTAGNGTLAVGAAAAGARIEGFEIDKDRADRGSRVLKDAGAQFVNIRARAFEVNTDGGFAGMGFDAVLANPPFEAIKAEKVVDREGRTLSISRLDHRIVYDALNQVRADNGRSFLVLPGEMMGEGKLEGATRFFNNYLHATFEVAGAAMLDGRLYRKSGAEFPVIVYALGPRLENPLSAESAKKIPDVLPYLHTTDQLFSWGDAARTAMDEIMARRSVAAPRAVARTFVAPDFDDDLPMQEGIGNDVPALALPVAPSLDPRPDLEDIAAAEAAVREEELPEDEANFVVSPDVLIDDLVIENDPFQVTYESASRVGGPVLKIQKALAEPVALALTELERVRGPVDDFVADSIGVSVSELGSVLHAGQVDGVGLALHKALRAESIIVGDLMGVGKGRQLAALARAAFKDDRPVLFFTDNASLFTDFVARDLSTVMRQRANELPQLIRPYIVNSSKDASILDPDYEGERRRGQGFVFRAAASSAKREKAIDPSINMVLSSYSQLGAQGREAKLAAIMEWLGKQDKPPLLIMDESHRAAGEGSNVGISMTALVEGVKAAGGSVAYASGTALKGARNLRVYGSALPDVGIPPDRLVELIEKEPLALQEALSYEMARSGGLIARELDNTDVSRETVSLQDVDPVRFAQVLEKVDLFANKMSELLSLGREVKDWSQHRQKELKKDIERMPEGAERDRALGAVGVHYQSPASRFHHLSNYLTLAINGVFLEDLVLKSISEGRKPLVAVANTGDTLMRDLIASQWDNEGADDDDGASFMKGSAYVLPEKPHLGHVIKRVADRLLTVKESNGFGAVTEIRLHEYEDWLTDFNARVDASDFSMLSMTVIDDLAVALEKHGLSLGEITGRAFMSRPAEDGSGFVVSARSKPLKQDVVSDFNNGRVDVLILNQSAAVGLSAQASPANGFDVRQREMIKAQMQGDVTQERQMDGRINRVGQIHPPLYTVPLQGLASSDRLAQLFNRKNRSLTAASTATRENESNIKDTLDLLNEVGQFVSREYLKGNPDIAMTLDIDPESDIETKYSEKLMGRMIALPSGMQRTIMGELDTAFQMRVALLDALGENPLRLREYDWSAQVKEVASLISGNAAAARMSERPLALNKLTYKETIKPIDVTAVEEAVARGKGWMVDPTLGREMSISERLDSLAPSGEDTKFSDPIFDRVMNRSDDLRSLGATEHPLEMVQDFWDTQWSRDADREIKGLEKLVLDAGNKLNFLLDIAPVLTPGAIVTVYPKLVSRLRDSTLFNAAVDYIDGTDHTDREIGLPAVITDVRFNEEKPLNLGEWSVRIAVPGEEHLIDMPMASVYAILREELQATIEAKGQTKIWAFRSARLDDDGIGLARAIAPLWSQPLSVALDEAQSKGEHPDFANGAERMHWKPYLGDGSPEDSVMMALFHNVQGGSVNRTRYAVEGNLFAAVSALAGKRMGEKAMYTDDTGAIRHCFLLKRDGHKKVLDQLTSSVASRVGFMKADVDSVSGLLTGMTGIISGSDDDARAAFIASDMLTRMIHGGCKVKIDDVRDLIRPRLKDLHVQLVKAVRQQGSINTGLFVGTDPFGDSTQKLFAPGASIRVREGASDEGSGFRVHWDQKEIARCTASLGEKGAFAAFGGKTIGVVVKAKNDVCDKAKNALCADWSNKLGTAVVRNSTVAKEIASSLEAAEVLCAAANDKSLDGMIGIKGALVVYNEIMTNLSRELIAQNLGATKEATASVRSDRAAAPAVAAM
ncbi:strawberry notch-like NTP hydrolase domain-containing protein [Agrobacterium tumefaciens]|uniref:strawberry notch-like NTP hydrolase domain-containing protein n=1 Tax=Agrobacterium tumefaciens TaxID=358 RepID=UPI0015732DE6|nr:strawberry notch family protein [Agrobacterium tumefaciens]NSX94413.1 hypothetical protein [Agrobacterium tumefaciens]